MSPCQVPLLGRYDDRARGQRRTRRGTAFHLNHVRSSLCERGRVRERAGQPLPAEAYSNARDIVELLDRLELGAAALVGVSLGGRVALEVALARPDLVERLVLAGVGLPRPRVVGHGPGGTARRRMPRSPAATSTLPSRQTWACG